MKLISKLLLIFLMLGLISVCLPHKVLAVSYEGVSSFKIFQQKATQGNADAQYNLALSYYLGSSGTPAPSSRPVTSQMPL